ncbi:MAG: FKBP-type peptidyl-prolyl cis-trans isomerase [Bacteroidota bacterium]
MFKNLINIKLGIAATGLVIAGLCLPVADASAQAAKKKTPASAAKAGAKKAGAAKPKESAGEQSLNEGPALDGPHSRPNLKSKYTVDGLEYFFFKKNNGKKARLGDIITMHIEYRTHQDSLLGSTRAAGNPIRIKAAEPPFKGGLESGLMMVSPGDSVVFFIPADSVLKDYPRDHWPPAVHSKTKLAYYLKVVDINTEAELIQKETDALMTYAKSKKLQVRKSENGLMYAITEEGTGVQARAGDSVAVHYTGMLTDGKVFDSSKQSGQPIEFVLGTHRVIQGWDQGIALLKEGTKAVLLIPSALAYGPNGSPPTIPGYAPLVFEVELVRTHTPKAKPAGTMQAPGQK